MNKACLFFWKQLLTFGLLTYWLKTSGGKNGRKREKVKKREIERTPQPSVWTKPVVCVRACVANSCQGGHQSIPLRWWHTSPWMLFQSLLKGKVATLTIILISILPLGVSVNTQQKGRPHVLYDCAILVIPAGKRCRVKWCAFRTLSLSLLSNAFRYGMTSTSLFHLHKPTWQICACPFILHSKLPFQKE